jgi:hypothetical protein
VKLARDAADLLEQYCEINRFDATFAIESILRLHVPILIARKKATVAAETKTRS